MLLFICQLSRDVYGYDDIVEHHLQTNHQIDTDSTTCLTYFSDCYQRFTLESWFTNWEQTQLNSSQKLPVPSKRLINGLKQDWLQ